MRILAVTLIIHAAIAPPLRPRTRASSFSRRRFAPCLSSIAMNAMPSSAKKMRGGLLLDSRDGVRKGGDSGPAIVPGDPDKSLLIKAVRYTDPEMKMPKKGKLPAALIADLEAWVKMGRPDPRDRATTLKAAKSWDEIVRERRTWWSLQPVKQPSVPKPKNADWSKRSDRSLLARGMEEKGLTPATGRRSAHANSTLESGADGIAADRGTRSRSLRRRGMRRALNGKRCCNNLLIGCLPRLTSASAGRGTGWMSSASPRRMATNGTTMSITPGAIAIT